MLKRHVDILYYVTLNFEYTDEDHRRLEVACDCFGDLLLHHCGGMLRATNYHLDIISGHVVQQSKQCESLWRYRNEGVEGLNAFITRSSCSLSYHSWHCDIAPPIGAGMASVILMVQKE
jgi:hypothetical protein